LSRSGGAGGQVQDRVEQQRRGGPVEGLAARRHLVEHDTEGENVAARVEVPALRLLGRHVGDRSDGRAGARQLLLARDRGRERGVGALPPALARDQLGEAEVEHFRLAPRGHEDVGGLDVAVDDPLRVSGVERVGDLDR